MADKVVVALNALINPDTAGGSESSALSIIMNFRDVSANGIDMYVTALPRYADRMRAIRGAPEKVIEWPWGQFVVVSSEPRAEWARKLRLRIDGGPLAGAFDYASRAINRRIFLRSMPSRADIDSLLDSYGVEVVHFTYPAKWPTRRPFIFEPHDVGHLTFPEFFPPDVHHWRREVYTDGIRNSAFVVCGTWWTKRDMMKQYGVPASQIAVVPRSSTMARASVTPEEEAAIAAEAKLPAEFMYYPAMTFHHKNHIRLLEAVKLLRDRKNIRLNLICTGRPYKPYHTTVAEALNRLKLKSQVRFLGPVSAELLAVCYRRAKFIIFPSLFEGHSQALLEALYHRKPIIGAMQSSIPETVETAGYLFYATDVEAIAAAMERAWHDPRLLDQLAANTEGSFARYRWDRAALTLAACYKQAAGRSLSADERAALDCALLEHKPDNA